MLPFLAIAVLSLLGSAVSVYFLIPILSKKAFLDIPNERSSHIKVTPRGGGWGIIIGIFLGSITAYILGSPLPHPVFYVGLLIIAITSFMDDRKSLPISVRISMHILAMGLVLYFTGGLKRLPFPAPLDFELGYFGYFISAVWIVAALNFYNFLDGIDGFAGSQGIIAGIGIALLQWPNAGAVVGISIAFACLGFLWYNWQPAKVFMGDVGSVSLGFAFATLPFCVQPQSSEALVYSMALFLWFFLADASFTLARRILNKERIWDAHRSHLYQRLNKSGWAHRSVVIFVMVLSLAVVFIQVYFFKIGEAMQWKSAGIALLLFLAYVAFVSFKESRKTNH